MEGEDLQTLPLIPFRGLCLGVHSSHRTAAGYYAAELYQNLACAGADIPVPP